MPAPLTGLRVLDLSRVLAGPWCGQIMADLGCEVIKVERPGRGDDTRGWGPPNLKDAEGRDTGEAGYYLAANRGKKSLTLDIASPEGQEIARALARKSDILIENYKVGSLKKYGLDYDSLHAIHPGLIYCSITGFGQTGPYAERPGYDVMAQAMGGLMSVTGERDDRPGGGPQRVGVAVSDIFTGVYSAVAILAALHHRDKTGAGQHLDMALLDVTLAIMSNQALNYLVSGVAPGRIGNEHPNVVPYQAFPTKDFHIVLAVGNDAQFARFCDIAGRPELAKDPRFATNSQRIVHRATIIPIVAEIMTEKTRAEWMEALEQAGIANGPINTLDQVFENPQVKARGMKIALPHPVAGSVPLVASPLRFSETPVAYDRAPPTVGQHTDEVLRDLLGFADGKIKVLREMKVV
jgi:crotonobetainyl-CoA:carnitine CoA-transferase CaiB-like acyl-CoA transferase